MTCARCSRNSASATALPSIRTSSMRATRRISAPRRRCGQPFSKPRRGCPVHSERCSTVGLLRGTAARFEWTPMLPWAADLVSQRKRSTRSTTTRRAHSSLKRKRWRSNTPTRSRTWVATVDDELFARLQRHYDDDTIAELTMIIAWENAGALPFGAPPVSAIEIAAPDLRRRAVVAQAPIGRARHAAMHAVRRHRAQARQSVPDPDRDCQIGPLKFD